MQRIRVLIVIFFSVEVFKCFIASIYCANEELSNDDCEPKQRTYYSNADKVKLLKIFHETDTGEWGHERRIKERWNQLNGREMPQTGHNLYKVIVRWMKNGDVEELLTEQERQSFCPFVSQKRIKWTPKMKEKLMELYFDSEPEKWAQAKRMKDLWDKRFPEYSYVRIKPLMMQVRHLLKERGEGDVAVKRIKLTEGEKEDLLRCYHQSLKHEGEELRIMRELFIKKYPQYAKLRTSNLRDRVHIIQQNNPEIEEKIFGRVSTFDTAHSSREPGETSGLKRVESTSVPTTEADHFPGASEQYFYPDRDNAWINDMIREGSFSNYQALPEIDTSNHGIHSGLPADHLIPSDPSASHQDILQYPGNIHTYQHVGESHQVKSLRQHHSRKKQKSSSKGKEIVLD